MIKKKKKRLSAKYSSTGNSSITDFLKICIKFAEYSPKFAENQKMFSAKFLFITENVQLNFEKSAENSLNIPPKFAVNLQKIEKIIKYSYSTNFFKLFKIQNPLKTERKFCVIFFFLLAIQK